VHLTSRSRPLTPLDWSRFQYIVGMDAKNKRDIIRATEYWWAWDSWALLGLLPLPLLLLLLLLLLPPLLLLLLLSTDRAHAGLTWAWVPPSVAELMQIHRIHLDPHLSQQAHLHAATRRVTSGVSADAIPSTYASSVELMTDYCTKFTSYKEVPDPYYGEPALLRSYYY
jgi:hypothetical protein